MAYSSASTIVNYSKDDDEIDLDDNDNHVETANADETTGTNPIRDCINTNNVDTKTTLPSEQVKLPDVQERPMSKAEAMKLRMRQLKQKVNQARQLNQQAVREEVENSIVGTSSSNGTPKQSMKKISSNTHSENHSSHALRLAQEHTDIDPKLLLQPAYENISKQQKRQDKEELNQFAINDYHNPEGQYRNYQRNIRSLPKQTDSTSASSVAAQDGVYDPTDMLTSTTDEIKKQRDGAHRISQELQRRYDKRQTKDRKRKQQEIRQELNNTSSTTAAASGINLRNQKFNQKIARTYDKTTSEIRHNLERGTAL